MKKAFSLTTLVLLASIVFISSCAKEEEGPPAQAVSYSGAWALIENSSDFGQSTYNVMITDTASNIQFAYLYGFNPYKTFALVNGNGFTIAPQLIAGSYISGGGVLTTPTRIDMTYYVQSTGTHYDTVVAVLNKM